jgi:hypothetical protein
MIHTHYNDNALQSLKYTSLTPVSSAISDQIALPFAGHRWYVVTAAALYGGLYSLALLLEVAYQFDQYGDFAVKAAPLVFFWIFVTSVCALAIDWKLTLRRSEKGLSFSATIFLIAAAVLFAAVRSFLPSFSVTQATFQTHTAQAAYLKSVIYSFSIALFFLVIPFHFVIAMQQELKAGRYQSALGILINDKLSVPPRGTIYIRAGILGSLLFLITVYSLIVRAYVLDQLIPTPHTNLFELLVYISVILLLSLAAYCLGWYYRALTELKRECLRVVLANAE